MARYTDWNGQRYDYDLDSYDPFKESREDRRWEASQDREDDTGDWDDWEE